MTLRAAVVTAHRWLGVIAAVLWLLQSITGIVAVFHWEIDDAMTSGVHRPTDWNAIEQRLHDFAPQSMWSTAGAADRYDVFLAGRVIRIDGAGDVLRIRRDGERFAHGGIVETMVVLHQSLLAGTRGRWIIGTSGFLLLSNLILGIIAAWPRDGRWKRALKPSRSGSRIASLYSWHRAAGLWLVVPALCIVTAGVLLSFDDTIERLLHASPDEPAGHRSGALRVGLAQATGTALARYRGAAVSGIAFPSTANATWTITLKQPGELQRAYGKTRVFVDATDGRIVADLNALDAKPARRFLDLLFPFHTGEMVGRAGRVAVLIVGVWLFSMIVLGIALWWTRRAARIVSRGRITSGR
ncbi:MAG: PepSY-associated TM helix domain-containing protein [Thermoanaerobaculia bacterium]